MIREAKAFRRVQEKTEELLAFGEWRLAKVVAVAIENVEQVENDGHGGNQTLRRCADVHTLLQLLKIAAASRIEGRDLAVQNRFARTDEFGESRQVGIPRSDVRAGASAQRQLPFGTVVNPGHGPDAVPFQLK